MPSPTGLRAARAMALVLAAVASSACATTPTMKLNHAEISGVRISFPPAVGVLMTLVVDVYNPNVYDVAVRAVRGQVLLANRYTLPVEFKVDGEGIWLSSEKTTPIRVPVDVPLELALTVLRESQSAPTIPYRFTGRADVTATRTFKLESDDYSVDEVGFVTRQQIESAVPGLF